MRRVWRFAGSLTGRQVLLLLAGVYLVQVCLAYAMVRKYGRVYEAQGVKARVELENRGLYFIPFLGYMPIVMYRVVSPGLDIDVWCGEYRGGTLTDSHSIYAIDWDSIEVETFPDHVRIYCYFMDDDRREPKWSFGRLPDGGAFIFDP